MTCTTHTVFNQPQPLSNSNLFLSDTRLCEVLSHLAHVKQVATLRRVRGAPFNTKK